MPRSCSASSVAALLFALALATAASAQTADGTTPAVEDICTKWGFTGQVNGLCKAYCEAMDCDDAAPQASEQACTRVLDKITTALGDTPFPTCEDADDDGVPNGLDNCPNVANADQADADPSTPEGDACEPVAELCPLLGGGDPQVPATTAALVADLEAFSPPGTLSLLESFCDDYNYIANINYIVPNGGSGSGQSGWLFQVNDGFGSFPSVASSFIIDETGAQIRRFTNVLYDHLTPEEQAACLDVLAAIQAADPFGVCAD